MNDEFIRKIARLAFADGVEAGVAQVRPAPDWSSAEGQPTSALWEASASRKLLDDLLRLLASADRL